MRRWRCPVGKTYPMPPVFGGFLFHIRFKQLMVAAINLHSGILPKMSIFPRNMLTEDNHPSSPIGGSLVGQNSDPN